MLQRSDGWGLISAAQRAPAEGAPPHLDVDSKSPGSGIVRENAGDGRIIIHDDRCTYSIAGLAPGVIELRIVGTDTGQFGSAIIDEVALALIREHVLELLVDAVEGSIVSVGVTTAWARFFEINRSKLQRVTVLASTRAMTLAMGFVRFLSRTGDLIRILSDRDAYEARKAVFARPRPTVR